MLKIHIEDINITYHRNSDTAQPVNQLRTHPQSTPEQTVSGAERRVKEHLHRFLLQKISLHNGNTRCILEPEVRPHYIV